jgi:Glycosyltransferase sugar-binding region containing DXD motif
MTIPRIVHFVFGLRPQTEAFHPLHYVAIESCRRVLEPDQIRLHYHHLPWGLYWDAIRPRLSLNHVGLVEEVRGAHYDEGLVHAQYRYAHHADFVRLDALIEQGGIYADIDTVFLRPFPAEFYRESFVIGREQPVRDERSGETKPSLCNAMLMAEPGARFAREWRQRMAGALNGTWSNHSGFLAQALSEELEAAVRVEPERSFFPVPVSREGFAALLEEQSPVSSPAGLEGSYSVHLWSHLWWQAERCDWSRRSAADFDVKGLRASHSLLARLALPYLPEIAPDDLGSAVAGRVVDGVPPFDARLPPPIGSG